MQTGATPERARGYELITRRLCLIKDTGHVGTLWGGTMMSWVDEAGAIYASLKTANDKLVTKAFTQIDFRRAVRPGDTVDFYGKIARLGTSSIAIELRVLAHSPTRREPWEVLTVTGVFVAVDERGEKTPIRPAAGVGS
ncbi:MAG: acyl-CoA thioesterase [Thermoplasmatota archaeon]